MFKMRKLAGIIAAAILGASVAAASASAYDITGGSYVGSSTAPHSLTFGGVYTVTCHVDFAGHTENVVGDTAATDMTPAYSNCDFFGLPATVTSAAPIRLKVTADWPPFSLSIDLYILGIKLIEIPIVGCQVAVSSPQSLLDGTGGNSIVGANVGSDFEWGASVQNIAYTTNGACPFGSGSDGAYDTNGPVTLQGVSVVP
ncbi:MAG: hypothetical protein ITG02_04130 [Patulibacter sp.]|nr:hypothetical protein [Patulibacter sp.]